MTTITIVFIIFVMVIFTVTRAVEIMNLVVCK